MILILLCYHDLNVHYNIFLTLVECPRENQLRHGVHVDYLKYILIWNEYLYIT